LATQVVSRLRSVFGVEIPLRKIFESPTVAGLAREVETARAAGQGLETPPIVRVPRDGSLPVSFSQERLWFLQQLEPENPAYNIPAALRLSGPLAVSTLARALGEIVRRHEVLRTTFEPAVGQPRQVIAPWAEAPLGVVDLAGLPERVRQ